MGAVPRRLLLFLILVVSVFSPTVGPLFAARAPAGPRNLRLTPSPTMVDVGGDVTFTLSASGWPSGSGVLLTFVSPHHGFSGHMIWESQCACFRLAVFVAKRVHPLERAQATATVTFKGGKAVAHTGFLIRGLAANGVSFAPGGPASLSAWVADPTPIANEVEHYCAWVTTQDQLGVAAVPVHVTVHFLGHARSYSAGSTNSLGLACARQSVGSVSPGKAITVDVYAGTLHTRLTFTPRS